MKPKLIHALKSLKVTVPISLVILMVMWGLALFDWENASKVIDLEEYHFILGYILVWGIPGVTLAVRFFSYRDQDGARENRTR